VAGLLAAFTAWRLILRERPPEEERAGFASVPFTSPVIAGLQPEPPAAAPAGARAAADAAD
jgi:hypothetical protein